MFNKEAHKIEDSHVVNEFPDVFLYELPGLPPDREIEFTIDLAPSTVSNGTNGDEGIGNSIAINNLKFIFYIM